MAKSVNVAELQFGTQLTHCRLWIQVLIPDSVSIMHTLCMRCHGVPSHSIEGAMQIIVSQSTPVLGGFAVPFCL